MVEIESMLRSALGVLLSLAVLITVVVIYFLPTLFAFRAKQGAGVFVLNLFLGWTGIGWIAAMIWGAAIAGNKRVRDAATEQEAAAPSQKSPPRPLDQVEPDDRGRIS